MEAWIDECWVRTGQLVIALADQFRGYVETSDAAGWYLRADDGELGGPWLTEELTPASECLVAVDGYVRKTDLDPQWEA